MDSNLRLTPILHPLAKLLKQTDIQDGGEGCVMSTQEYIKKVVEDEDFKSGSQVLHSDCDWRSHVTLKDLLGTIHHKVIDEGGYKKDIIVGAALILVNVSVFSPKPSMHYLNITMRNVVKVFRKDTVPGSGSGVGGSGMLMEEEEIVKLMEEEEMADLELQVCGNVTDQEDLYKFDEDALNLALKEEARQAQAEQELLEKCRQEEELDEEHERQL
ncbi:reverse transcriptase zinc-binding domain-containing protein [Tanacetum coccineum]